MAEEYSNEDRIRKLQKLRDLAEHPRTEATLAAAAREQIDKLIRQWEINPEILEAEKIEDFYIKIPAGARDIFIHVAHYLELESFSITRGGKKVKNKMVVKCTKSDLDLYSTLLEKTMQSRDRKQKELKKAMGVSLNSYMVGMVMASFPVGPSKCRECSEPEAPAGRYAYARSERRWICGACGFRGHKLRPKSYDSSALLEGQAHGAKLRPDRLLETAR